MFFLAATNAGTWLAASLNGVTVRHGVVESTSVSLLHPYLLVCYVAALLGVYCFVAALADWPLPGRKAARKAEEDKDVAAQAAYWFRRQQDK